MKKINFAEIGMKVAGLGAGSAGAAIVQSKLLSNVGQKISPFIIIAAGVALPMFMPKQKIVGHIGDGMVARGVSDALAVFMPDLVPGVSGSDEPVSVYGIADLDLEDAPVQVEGVGESEVTDDVVRTF